MPLLNFLNLYNLSQAEKFINKNKEIYCQSMLYKGINPYRLNEYLKADSILKNCSQCYQNNSEITANTKKHGIAAAVEVN